MCVAVTFTPHAFRVICVVVDSGLVQGLLKAKVNQLTANGAEEGRSSPLHEIAKLRRTHWTQNEQGGS